MSGYELDTVRGAKAVIDRLAAYEDFMKRWRLRDLEEAGRIFRRVNALGGTDLMAQYRDLGPIEHLRELAHAEKDGRLVVLPAKPDEIVYQWKKGDDVPSMFRLDGVTINGDEEIIYQTYWGETFTPDDFGKTVFLTRKEAEAALKEREEG